MIKSGKYVRFEPEEIAEGRQLGLDLSRVRTMADFSDEVIALVRALEVDRPALLHKLAQELAKETGIRLPAQLRVVPERGESE